MTPEAESDGASVDSYALSEELSTEVETKPSVLLAPGVHLDCHVDTADLGAHCLQLLVDH